MGSTLDSISANLLWVAIGLYAVAFILFTLDLSGRGATREANLSAAGAIARSRASAKRSEVGSRRSEVVLNGTTLVLEAQSEHANDDPRTTEATHRLASIGLIITLVGWLIHLAATITRGISGGRVPWSNLYEFAMTATLIVMGVFLVSQLKRELRFLGTFVVGMIVVLLGISTLGFYVVVAPLQPALQSPWLVIHVFIASLATGMMALGAALSFTQLMQAKRESLSDSARAVKMRLFATLPTSERLEQLAYRMNIIGFIFWTFTLIAGAIWAQAAWGRYWGWDTKEVWTFIIWVIYAGYVHARATQGWRGSPSSWLSLVGFAAVLFNFGIVNVFFKGLHAYSGLPLPTE